MENNPLRIILIEYGEKKKRKKIMAEQALKFRRKMRKRRGSGNETI